MKSGAKKAQTITTKEIKELKESVKTLPKMIENLSNMAGVVHEESLYVMDKLRKDEAAEKLLPHYSLILEIFKRSNVFISADSHKEFVSQLNETLRALDSKINEATKLSREVAFVGVCPSCGGHTFCKDVGANGENAMEREVLCLSCGKSHIRPNVFVDMMKRDIKRRMLESKNGGDKNGRWSKILGFIRRD